MSKRRNGALWLAACMLFIAAGLHIADARIRTAAALRQTVQITGQPIHYGNEDLIYDIVIPVVSGFADAAFERGLNARIEAQIASDRAKAQRIAQDYMQQARNWSIPPYDCVFSAGYEAKCLAGILSLKVTTLLDNGGTGMPHTVYYNADVDRCAVLTLNDLFTGDEYKARIDPMIDAQLRRDPERYDVPFKGVTQQTQFFVANGRLFIAFAKYEIASGMTGEPEFEIPTQAVRDILKAKYTGLFSG